jgi:hypothetical protein
MQQFPKKIPKIIKSQGLEAFMVQLNSLKKALRYGSQGFMFLPEHLFAFIYCC